MAEKNVIEMVPRKATVDFRWEYPHPSTGVPTAITVPVTIRRLEANNYEVFLPRLGRADKHFK